MPKTRPPYPAEYRQQTTELVAAGRTAGDLSLEFGRCAQIIANRAASGGVTAGAAR